jgi:hypothetical protein
VWPWRSLSAIHPLLSAASSLRKLQFPLTKGYRPPYDFFIKFNLSFFGNETLIFIWKRFSVLFLPRRSTSNTDNSVA